MNAPIKSLADDKARLTAITIHDRSFLVEAGAGSGKTAVMAGRIAMMLACGIAPKSLAAVTFTELAASELLIRVREFVTELSGGHVPTELRIALPKGLSDKQKLHLEAAMTAIDDITCSTIHGFCQRLIKPYPVEANIDPGATLMDRDQADLSFLDVTDSWLREELTKETSGLLTEMVLQDPSKTVDLIRTILGSLRRHPDLTVDASGNVQPLITTFRTTADEFSDFVKTAEADEPETAAITTCFSDMAKAIPTKISDGSPADLVRLLLTGPHEDLCKADGDFLKYRKKGKWGEAVKRAGLPKADGDRLNTAADGHYTACCNAWNDLSQAVASRVLSDLIDLTKPVVERFRAYKRSAALLDFDDLIFAARNLLRDHEDVRNALAKRFAHVLVDEFQDTDPLQTEIFWRLSGDPSAVSPNNNEWASFQIRPGALFLVGDPKQAIYRFRGADVAAYVSAREAFRGQDPDSILSISTNFRSCEPILTFVNERFENILSTANGQPGFTALNALHPKRDAGPSVAALDIAVAGGDGKASAEDQRDGEAEAVAEMCARLIGNEVIIDRKTRERHPCRPGDIALLAPTGKDLWRYEEALERRGIPVATQAGKGLFQRQEIQDLIAITRVLADRNDTLALGALLRGPLVGLSEEDLLDITWELPRIKDRPDTLRPLTLSEDSASIKHPHARDIIEKLQSLRLKINATTPYDLLSQAVDVLRVRPLLLQRHRNQAERALSNVDLYLSLSRAYGVRGLRAFAEAMQSAWSDEARAVEGRPDAQEEAVALYTMHASKGLEWPIVVPINTMSRTISTSGAITDRGNNRFYCPVFGIKPTGYETALTNEGAELERERIRLWYVAATRARELLVLPRVDVDLAASAWISLLELSLPDLPALDLNHLPLGFDTAASGTKNIQTRESFAQEAKTIAERQRHLVWLAPSRDESGTGPVLQSEGTEILIANTDGATVEDTATAEIQGGLERGLILHKLIEEVLIGETQETATALTTRAETLIQNIGQSVAKDPAKGLNPDEIAGTVVRALSLPEIAALRPNLLPELPVYASNETEGHEQATYGIADAIALGPDGKPHTIVDWKSDINPTPETIEHYRSQVRAYLDMTQTERGLIVLATKGLVIPVTLH